MVLSQEMKGHLIIALVLGGIFVLSLVWVGEALILTFPASLALGYLYRPNKLWLYWIIASLVMIVTSIVLEALGIGPEYGSGENPETAWSVLFEAPIFVGMLVVLPLMLGKLVATRWRSRSD